MRRTIYQNLPLIHQEKLLDLTEVMKKDCYFYLKKYLFEQEKNVS